MRPLAASHPFVRGEIKIWLYLALSSFSPFYFLSLSLSEILFFFLKPLFQCAPFRFRYVPANLVGIKGDLVKTDPDSHGRAVDIFVPSKKSHRTRPSRLMKGRGDYIN